MRHKKMEKKNKKCGDWCEDPVKREKERCSGSYCQGPTLTGFQS